MGSGGGGGSTVSYSEPPSELRPALGPAAEQIKQTQQLLPLTRFTAWQPRTVAGTNPYYEYAFQLSKALPFQTASQELMFGRAPAGTTVFPGMRASGPQLTEATWLPSGPATATVPSNDYLTRLFPAPTYTAPRAPYPEPSGSFIDNLGSATPTADYYASPTMTPEQIASTYPFATPPVETPNPPVYTPPVYTPPATTEGPATTTPNAPSSTPTTPELSGVPSGTIVPSIPTALNAPEMQTTLDNYANTQRIKAEMEANVRQMWTDTANYVSSYGGDTSTLTADFYPWIQANQASADIIPYPSGYEFPSLSTPEPTTPTPAQMAATLPPQSPGSGVPYGVVSASPPPANPAVDVQAIIDAQVRQNFEQQLQAQIAAAAQAAAQAEAERRVREAELAEQERRRMNTNTSWLRG